MTIPLASGIFMIFCFISVMVVSWERGKSAGFIYWSTAESLNLCTDSKKEKDNKHLVNWQGVRWSPLEIAQQLAGCLNFWLSKDTSSTQTIPPRPTGGATHF